MPNYFKRINAEDIETENEIKAESVSAEHLHSNSNPTEAVVYKGNDGTIYADGKDGKLASDTSIDAVLNTLVSNEAPGLNIRIKQDTYQQQSVVRVDKDRVRITGEGWGTVIERHWEDSTESMLSFGDKENEIAVADCYLGHIAFDGRRSQINNSGRQNVLIHSGSNPTSFDDISYFSKRCTFDTVKSINSPEDGLTVDFGYNCRVINCYSDNSYQAGIVMYKSWYGYIANNFIENTQNDEGYKLNASVRSAVLGNVSKNSFNYGYRLSDKSGWPTKGNRLIGNYALDDTDRGVYLTGGAGKGTKYNIIAGNVIVGADQGIEAQIVDYNTIFYNIIQDVTGAYGIQLTGDSKFNRISNNHILDPSGNWAAILIADANSVYPAHTHVTDNLINSTTGTEWKHGVNVSGGGFTVIHDNKTASASNSPYADSGTKTRIDGVIQGTYTGDGSSSRDINLQFKPKQIIVEDGAGNVYDWFKGLGNGIIGSSPSGTLEGNDNRTIRIGDNGSDADPNTNGETYTFWAR